MAEVKINDPDVPKSSKAFVPLGKLFPVLREVPLAKQNRE
jgi:hypothetical protein